MDTFAPRGSVANIGNQPEQSAVTTSMQRITQFDDSDNYSASWRVFVGVSREQMRDYDNTFTHAVNLCAKIVRFTFNIHETSEVRLTINHVARWNPIRGRTRPEKCTKMQNLLAVFENFGIKLGTPDVRRHSPNPSHHSRKLYPM